MFSLMNRVGCQVRSLLTPSLRHLAAAALVLTTAAGASCSSHDKGDYTEISVQPKVLDSLRRYEKQFVLSAGDALDVVVFRDPEVTRACVIRPDGFISIPTLHDVKAAGLTVNELTKSISELLAKRRQNPEVTVVVTNTRQPTVFVMGEVNRPGPLALRDAATAAQAVAYAGGLKYTANRQAVAVVRLTPDGLLRAYKIMPSSGQVEPYLMLQSMVLQPDDLILVPESPIALFDRFMNEFINQPLIGANAVLSTFVNYRLVERLGAT